MSEMLANQIAAGEVVERPASCVKELLENSMDAGAREIRVSLGEGGISFIRVQDNGAGMVEEDALLAFARHATSKLKSPRDLLRINSLGFRGEALASIAAVAKVLLQTRVPHSSQGIQVELQGGQLMTQPQPVGMPPGTVLEVHQLFFNTPARLKYLRSVQTEQSRCVAVVQTAALSRPDIRFTLEIEDRIVFQSFGRGSLREVLAGLYGAGEAAQLLSVTAHSPDYQVSGFIARPTQARASRNHLQIFINRRPVRNLALYQAVEAGYRGRLMVNRHPICALHLMMDPGLVDVNIHPHKAEVRLSEERDVAEVVQQSVTHALEIAFLVPDVRAPKAQSLPTQQTRLPLTSVDNRGSRSYQMLVREKETVLQPTQSSTTGISVDKQESNKTCGGSANYKENGLDHDLNLQDTPNLANLRPIAQALGMYIVADDGDALYIIDQHAAHERVLFERFSERLQVQQVQSMSLLAPMTLHPEPILYEAALQHLQALTELGLAVEDFGSQSLLIREVPAIWEGLDASVLTEDLLQAVVGTDRTIGASDVLRERVALQACKSAVKANHSLSQIEMEALCEALAKAKDPFHCPHGRPVLIRLTNRELEKEFRRIV
ncbi:DNA mismatch repair endonuclease MutL [Alicyclobacillaceae bacterium I2511]|nr:DNA mismatch repair endonuclease MutL [Alicyclobacillaceae bacterium I2511]